ncbi:MAG: biopolymer transporter ExbD [Myxococcales bacterium]|nr:biopolymer transporter ExbD [Myxococcales bacterium]
MAAQAPAGEDDLIVGINVTPLVDIVLVLLVILMVTASYVASQSIPLELPRAATGEAAPQLLAVTIDQHGAISLDASPIDERALREHVRRMQRQAGGAALTAAIAADGRARHAQVVRVVDVLRQERVTRFALHVEAAPEPGR